MLIAYHNGFFHGLRPDGRLVISNSLQGLLEWDTGQEAPTCVTYDRLQEAWLTA